MELQEENLLEIERNKNIIKTENIVGEGAPIAITQKYFRGEFYNSLKLFPLKGDKIILYRLYG